MASVSAEISSDVKVKGFKIDDLLIPKKVDLLKINTEGSEYSILLGAQKTLERTTRIILEISDQKEEIIRLLLCKNFKLKKLKFTSYILAYKNE